MCNFVAQYLLIHEKSPYHRHYGPGRLLSYRAVAGQRLRGTWHHPPVPVFFNTDRIDHLTANPRLKLHHGDITDSSNLNKLLSQIQPDEIYNLAAQSHVQVSFEVPEYTAQVDAMGTLRILDAMLNHCPQARFYQASTSELYGKVQEIPQKETTPFYPRSPYGVAKIYGFWIVKNFREVYNLYALQRHSLQPRVGAQRARPL